MPSPFTRTYVSVEEVMKLHPHLPKESILLTHTTTGLPEIISTPLKKNRKCIKRGEFNVSQTTSDKLPSIK